MRDRLNVLLAGRNSEAIAPVEGPLRGIQGLAVTTKHIGNGHCDPLHDQPDSPDALILVVEAGDVGVLSALGTRPAGQWPPVLVIGPGNDTSLIRSAMRAGARDFLETPVAASDLGDFITGVRRDHAQAAAAGQSKLTAIINAKGGSGGSMVAANLARLLAESPKRRTVLMYLDVQFGALPAYFNLEPVNGLVQALECVDSLDPVALKAYVLSHASRLDLIASTPGDLILASDIQEQQVEHLLRVLAEAYDDIVVDLPRWISESVAAVLERADRVLVVMQQSVVHLRDAQRMIRIMERELGVPAERITVIVNRFDKRDAITLADIREALAPVGVVSLPNDFRRVTESINLGSPLLDLAPRATLTRELRDLASSVSPHSNGVPGQRGLWRRLTGART